MNFSTLMLQCWFIEPETRPRFTEILAELKRMEEEPTRYVTPSAFTPKTPKTAKTFHSRLHSMVSSSSNRHQSNTSESKENYFFKIKI